MLSDKEKQEIIRRIESGQPLPDKYRWILFDNTVLSFQTIEQVDEPRAEKKMLTDK